MLGLSGHLPEIVIVLVVLMIIWGPGKLADIGSALGRGIREFRSAASEQGAAEAPSPNSDVDHATQSIAEQPK